MIASAAVEDLAPGATVDRYRLVARLGEGGQGEVWRAEDALHPGALVALKLISLPAASSTAADRLRREARLLARLEHPSLPRCHAIFEDPRKDILGFALDLVDGVSLAELQGTPALSAERRLDILLHLAGALRFVHQTGLVHRDIKASNVVIDDAFFASPKDPSTVKLLDFGIAAEQDNPRRLTAPGSVIGTVSHLAPELLDQGFWREKADGPARDLFAFGVLAFELFQGRHPANTPLEATYGDYLAAYRGYATKERSWPIGVEGDLLEMVYRRCLALRAGERATSEEALILLQQAQSTLRGRREQAIAPRVSATSPTRVATPGVDLPAAPAPISIQTTSRSWVFTPPPPSSQPATSTDAPRLSSAPGFTAPSPLSTPWPPGVAPLIPASPERTKRSSEEGKGPARTSLLAPVLLGAFVALAVVIAFVVKGESEEPTEQLPFVFSAPTSPEVPTPFPLVPSPQASLKPPPRAAFPPDDPPPVVAVRCPRGMELIPDGGRVCIDRTEVTVDAYVKSGAPLADEAYWPRADAGDLARQTENCASHRMGTRKVPVNCVSWLDAKAYCEKRGQRLPSFDELERASTVISRCTQPDKVCPIFEWSLDEGQSRSYHKTWGPSFNHPDIAIGSNDETARNDDLGFRCVVDILP